MGNCLFGGFGDHENEVIKVITSSGGIMEFYEPTTAESITDEFPGHVIFRSHDLFWNPIPHNEMLLAAGSDYGQQNQLQIGHVRSNSRPLAASHCSSTIAPYRMSFDHCSRKLFKKTSSSLSLPSAYSVARGQAGSGGLRLCKQSNKSNSNKYMSTGGIWKVKLVISPEQLAEILSQEVRTQELIESVRTVAKCGKNYKNCLSTSSESAFSDLWGLSVSTTNIRN
ncbi:uncharacterized protein LOC141697692 [Apium graveolens]|uniref:uncharacterized protein LOC141697692 n=1 Tax=Apium graveolens TaxID=4045 RepID=UPI003D79C5D6